MALAVPLGGDLEKGDVANRLTALDLYLKKSGPRLRDYLLDIAVATWPDQTPVAAEALRRLAKHPQGVFPADLVARGGWLLERRNSCRGDRRPAGHHRNTNVDSPAGFPRLQRRACTSRRCCRRRTAERKGRERSSAEIGDRNGPRRAPGMPRIAAAIEGASALCHWRLKALKEPRPGG